MADHDLKCWPAPFEAMKRRVKTFEFRKNDRNYQIGDTLTLLEYDPEPASYTGNWIARVVTYILHGGEFGVPEGYVIMAVE